mmetsp:Transcript_107123/g.255753  ORF Transcript_107123/g.255753 Transcript_107123/m.255753 type:complete len:237 (+) Transcript_107123:77-787(+)
MGQGGPGVFAGSGAIATQHLRMLFVVHFRHDSRQHQERFPDPLPARFDHLANLLPREICHLFAREVLQVGDGRARPLHGRRGETIWELQVNFINSLECLLRKPSLEILDDLGVLSLAKGVQHLVPALVANWPDRIQRKTIALIGTIHQELPQLSLFQRSPRRILIAVPDDQELIIQLLREVEIEALCTMSDGSTGGRHFHHIADEPNRGVVTKTQLWNFRVKTFLAGFFFQDLQPS